MNKKNLLKQVYLNGIESTTDLLIFSIFYEEGKNLKLAEKQIKLAKNLDIPIFPIDAAYLKSEHGFLESKELGNALQKLKHFWIDNNFEIDKTKIVNILKLKQV